MNIKIIMLLSGLSEIIFGMLLGLDDDLGLDRGRGVDRPYDDGLSEPVIEGVKGEDPFSGPSVLLVVGV